MAHAQLRQFVRWVLAEAKGKDPTQVAKDAIASYTEMSPAVVGKAALTEEDPSHQGVIAVRLMLHGEAMDFLVHNCDGQPDPMSDVEETHFESWPPKRKQQGGSRMQMRAGRMY